MREGRVYLRQEEPRTYEGGQGHEKGCGTKSRQGFGYSVHGIKVGPRNTAIKKLLGNEAYTEAVLTFVGNADVGEVKAEVLGRGRM